MNTPTGIDIAFHSAIGVAIVGTTPDGTITLFNKGAEQMLGYSAEEVIGKQTPVVFHLDSELQQRSNELSQYFQRPITHFEALVEWSKHWQLEEREWVYVKKNGSQIIVNLIVTPMIQEEEIIGFLGIAIDITQRKRAEEKLKKENKLLLDLSTKDSLTGVYNRRAFDERIRQEWNRALQTDGTLTLIILDIDRFKEYNDIYGHLCGDECLTITANLLYEAVRNETDFVARYGGEEFVIIIPNIESKHAEIITQRIRKTIADAKIEHMGSLEGGYLTCSLGVATVKPTEEMEVTELIAEADKALYQAKNQGRNQVVVVEM